MVSDSTIERSVCLTKRQRQGTEKTIVLEDISTGRATGQQSIIERMAALGYEPKVIRVLLWRLRCQGCVKITGAMKHRDYVYTIEPAGALYLKRVGKTKASPI